MHPILECTRKHTRVHMRVSNLYYTYVLLSVYIATLDNIIQSSVDAYLLFLRFHRYLLLFLRLRCWLPLFLGLLWHQPLQDVRNYPCVLPRIESGRYNGTDGNIFCIGKVFLTFTWFCSPLYDLSIHLIKTSFFLRSMFYATKQLSLEKIFHVRIPYLALICLSHARVHEFACKRGGRYFYSPQYMSFGCKYQ